MRRMKNIPPVAMFFVFLLLITDMPEISESQSRAPPMPARPLCMSQFALANHACSFLPYNPNPFEPPPPSEDPTEPQGGLEDNSNQDGNVVWALQAHSNHDGKVSGALQQAHSEQDGEAVGGLLQVNSNQDGKVAGVLHVDSDHNGNDHGNGDHHHGDGGQGDSHRRHAHSHSHRHRHRQRLARVYHESPVEHECCRWLKAVDDQCVCDVLVHLPVFLARPWHRFQLVVDETCNITYSCSGRVI